MADVVQENDIQATTNIARGLGLAIIATGFLVFNLISVLAGAIMVILGALVVGL